VASDWMRSRNRVLLISMPQSDSISPPPDGRLEAIVRAMENARTEPYSDSLLTQPLLGTLPAFGDIVEEREYPPVGVTEWRLENGARVLLKQTDFREDEVLMVARSPGGTSLVPDEDYLAALTASAVVQAGGLGELSQIELRKLLSGTVAGVGAEVSELHEGLAGAASGRDLETLFQLMHLRF